MIYKLENGYRVRATAVDGDGIEFETANAQRETISTVRQYGARAAETLIALRVADGLRFGKEYGRKA
jgi:hypothetical protein